MRSAALFDHDRTGQRPGGQGRRGRREGGRDREEREQQQRPEPRNGFLHDDRVDAEGGRGEPGRRGRGRSGRGAREGRGEGDYGRSGGGSSWQGGESRIPTKWEYVDPEGEIRGPFTAAEIHSWHVAGYFNSNLSIRMTGTSDFRRLAVVLAGITREAKGGPPAGQEARGRGGRGGDGLEEPGGGRGPRARREPVDYGSRPHPAEALSGRGEDGTDQGRGGRGRGPRESRGTREPRGSQLSGRESGRSEGGYNARDGDARPRRDSRQPRSAKVEQGGSDKGQLLFTLEVARRLFTGQARQGADEPVWRYIDLQGNVQGPFTAAQMLGWYESHHLVKMDLRLCGTERKVSPPNLPDPDLHYEEFGRMLTRVQNGVRFKPVTPDDIENGTVPTYPEASARQLGGRSELRGPREQRGPREPREPREAREPRPERGERPERGTRPERGERRERGGRGRRSRPADSAEATGDAGAVGSPRVGRGGRGRLDRAPRSEQAGVEEAGGARRERRRERRGGGRGGRRGDDKVEVALKVIEDGMISLTITPVKPPPRVAAEVKPAATEAPADTTGDWAAVEVAEPAKGNNAVLDVPSTPEATSKEASKPAKEDEAGEPTPATEPVAKGDWDAVDVEPGVVQRLPQPVAGKEVLADDVAAETVVEPVEVAPLLPADKPKSDEPAAAGSVASELPSSAPAADEQPAAEVTTKQDSFDLLAAGKAEVVEPAADSSEKAPEEEPSVVKEDSPAAEEAEDAAEKGNATPPIDIAEPAKPIEELSEGVTKPDVLPTEPTDISPEQPGVAGGISEKEAESTSKAAELSEGLDSLDKVSTGEGTKESAAEATPAAEMEPAAESAESPAEEQDINPAKEQDIKSPSADLTSQVEEELATKLPAKEEEAVKPATRTEDIAGEDAVPKEPEATKEAATGEGAADASTSDKESASSSDAPKKKTGFMASLIGRFEK